MEPPAVTSCGVGHSSTGIIGVQQHSQQQKRDNMNVGFLQIEPQLSFNTSNRHFEELPENFLETMSPQQHAGHGHSSMMSSSMGHNLDVVHSTTSPQLASLTTVSMATGSASGDSGYANLVPMPGSSHSHYLKMESMEHMGHHSQLHQTNQIEKNTFGSGPAGLLSPLQLESNRNEANSLSLLGGVHHHRPNGASRTSDLLSGIRRNNVSYIKEEINPAEIGYQTTHDYEANYSIQQPTPQELERMANAETPPALSNVEITSSILASLSRESPSPSIQHQQPTSQTHFIIHQMPRQQQQQQQHVMQHPAQSTGGSSRSSGSRKAKQSHQQQEAQRLAQNAINIDSYSSMGAETGTVTTYSINDMNDPLNAEIDDEIYIDTKDLCKRVAYELKQHSIPQAIFAERILCRSQGTLSDLLRNPKPWNRLKSGRETFKRMYNWLQQPLHIRLSILDMYKGPMASAGAIPPPTPAQNSRHHHRRRNSAGDDGQPQKRPRLVFTDIQKRTLQAIFKETQRPSREMQQTIAEHLRLDMSTVSNFFMNARRRSRNGNGLGDEPAPYQQIRTITPPPDSPPTSQQQHMISEQQQQHQPMPRRTKSGSMSHQQPTSAANLSHIEETVDEVVGRSIAYARKSQYAAPPPVGQVVVGQRSPVWEDEVVHTGGMPFASEEAEIVDDNSHEDMDQTGEHSSDHSKIEQDDLVEEQEIDSEMQKSAEDELVGQEQKVEEQEQGNSDAIDQEEDQAVRNLKSGSPMNDAEAPTAPGTPVNEEVVAEQDPVEDVQGEGEKTNEEDRGEEAP